jgi:hypothetical protein
MYFPRALVVLVLITAAGCATLPTRDNPSIAVRQDIGAAELRRVDAMNMYEAITRLRPTFFATRGATSFLNEPSSAIVVVVNRSIVGGVDELRSIEARAVRAVRRLSAADVFQLTGRSAPSGGIELIM